MTLWKGAAAVEELCVFGAAVGFCKMQREVRQRRESQPVGLTGGSVVARTTYYWWWVIEKGVYSSLRVPIASFEHQCGLEVIAARDGRDLLYQ